MMIDEPICIKCKHLNIETFTCAAFPEEIPEEIIIGDNDHKKPLPGQDNNIVFEPIQEIKNPG